MFAGQTKQATEERGHPGSIVAQKETKTRLLGVYGEKGEAEAVITISLVRIIKVNKVA